MKSLKITITKGTETVEQEVKSECAMWNALRKVRDEITEKQLQDGVRAVVVDMNGTPFKDITFRRNSKGKIEMPNAVKETNRVRPKKVSETKKAIEEAAVKAFKAHEARKAAAEAEGPISENEMKEVLSEVQEFAETEASV